MLSSKEDCGETLKAELRALRKKYGGFAVDFMNKVCQLEDGDSGDREPNDRGFRDPDGPENWFRRWNLNWPNVDSLASVYTDDHDCESSYVFCCLVEGNSFNDKYQPNPTIFLWTINALTAKSRKAGKIDRPFIISSSTAPSWAKILTSNVSERNLSKIRVNMDHSSDLTSLKIWAHESKVMFGVSLYHVIEEHIYDPFLSNLFLENRVTKLDIFDPYKFDSDVIPQHVLPSLEFLKVIKNPALERVRIMMFDDEDDDDMIDMERDINEILQSMTGLRSIRRLQLTMYSQRKSLDYFVDHFLTHPDCKVHDVDLKWIAEDLTIDTTLNVDRYDQYSATPLELEYLLKILDNYPSIRKLNYYDPKIWKYESNVRQPMVEFFVALQQNQVGRGFVQDQSCYRTPTSHGIFSHLLDRAFNRLDAKKHNSDYDYIQYEEGVEHHDQDHPYDGIYYMIKELAGRGVLGKADNISEEDENCIARPRKLRRC